MRNTAILKLFQDQLQCRHTFGVRLANDDGGITSRQRESAFDLKFDRAGTVDKGKVVAEKSGVGDVQRNAHAMIAGFGRRISHRGFIANIARTGDGASASENGLEQRGLAGEIRSNQSNAAGASAPAGFTSLRSGFLALGLPHGGGLLASGAWKEGAATRACQGRDVPMFAPELERRKPSRETSFRRIFLLRSNRIAKLCCAANVSKNRSGKVLFNLTGTILPA